MWSIGCVAFELLTDLPAFGCDKDDSLTPEDRRQAVLQHQAQWVSLHLVSLTAACHEAVCLLSGLLLPAVCPAVTAVRQG